MNPDIVADIQLRLDAVEQDHKVAIPLAIESGSRAWGFPSPDSDYDCRFIYVPRIQDSLSLFARRDVIETPVTPVFDVNGWELRKAIKLMLKGNAVVLEWLNSSFSYRRNEAFALAMLKLAESTFQRGGLANHYLRIMLSTQKEHFGDPANVSLKKVLYALRSALALRYLRVNADHKVLPMNITELCDGSDLLPSVRREIDSLIAVKTSASEIGTGRLAETFIALMTDEAEGAQILVSAGTKVSPDAKAEAEETYLDLLSRFSPP
jgi:uncharacterized protein